jgi:hypothetical protein
MHKISGKFGKKFVQFFVKKKLTMVRICGKIVAGLRPRSVADAQSFIIPQPAAACQ